MDASKPMYVQQGHQHHQQVEHDDVDDDFEGQYHDGKKRPQRRRRLEQSHPDIVGRIIRHRWVIDGDEVYCTGTVLGISAPGTVPEDSDDGEFIPGTCYDIQYDDEDFVRHLILEGDWQCGDVQVLGRAPTMP